MEELKTLDCAPCRTGAPRATPDEVGEYRRQIPEWEIVRDGGVERLYRVFRFKDFREALDFANRVGAIAEEQGHHPALLVEWGQVTVTWWTHKIHGLHRNDFVMAARTDTLYAKEAV